MIGGRSGRRGSRWPLFAVLAAMAALAVAGSSTMASRSLASKMDEAELRVSGFVAEEIAPSLEGIDLTEQIEGDDADRLTNKLQRGVLSSGATARVRVFAPNGILLYSSDEGDRVGSTSTGNVDLIRAAAGGALASTTGGDQVVTDGRAQSLQLLQVYAPLVADGPSEAAVGVDLRYKAIVASASRPWETIQFGAALAAVALLLLALFELARAITAKSLAARSGFTGTDAARAAARAAAKEAKVRHGLEDQIESARAQLRAREQENVHAAQRFATQLEELSRRLEEAERREAAPAGRIDDPAAVQAAIARAEQAEAREAAAKEAIGSLEEALARARSVPVADAGASEEAELLRAELAWTRERLQETGTGLDDARARASALEARVADAAALEGRLSAMEELERRVADAELALNVERQRAAATEDARAALEVQLAAAMVRGDEMTPELSAVTARAEEAEARARELQGELDARRSELETARAGTQTIRADLESVRREAADLTAALQMRDALIREAEERAAEAEGASAALTAAREAAGPGAARADDRVAELERALAGSNDELEQSQMRLRRAYAEVESVRAQLEAATPRMGLDADDGATSEIQRLRVELGQAIERAAAAESRASRLQADLAEARADSDPLDGGGSDAAGEDDDRSLRFRLARSAARKKGLGEDEQMWS